MGISMDKRLSATQGRKENEFTKEIRVTVT